MKEALELPSSSDFPEKLRQALPLGNLPMAMMYFLPYVVYWIYLFPTIEKSMGRI